jgi:pimeloyl-ACP methyl ester carboxylesterase
MATFVLVHGAWYGGWCYAPVARSLRAAGHEVFTPTLTGLGERSHLAGIKIDLSLHIRDLLNVLEYEDLQDVILCGHSYGGMVVTGAAARAAERIRGLVYIDAFLPRDGQALWDIVDEPSRAMYIDNQRDSAGLMAPPFAPPSPCPPDGPPVPRKPSRHPLLTVTEPVRLTGAETRIRNRTYIYADKVTPTLFTQFYDALRDHPAWKVRSIRTGHSVMTEDPEGLTALLLEEVDR